MIAVVGIVKNEADIVETWVRHTLAEDVDYIYLADGRSTDGTREILAALADETGQILVLPDEDEFVHQAAWTNCLAGLAADDGATWILPIDVDEFWYATSGETLASALSTCTDDKLYVRMWHHYDWDTKELLPKPLPKVAFRPTPGAVLVNGNHEVSISGGTWGILELRELQYRGAAHFVRKTRERNAAQDPAIEGPWHHLRFSNMTDDELLSWWERKEPFWGDQRQPISDPIPSRYHIGAGPLGTGQ